MEERKREEIEYYERKASEWTKEGKWETDFEGFEPLALESFRFCYQLLAKNCQGKIVLDYGCGNGIHSVAIAKMGAKKVIGIDLSEKSLEIAKERTKRENLEGKVEFLKEDCEKMKFEDNFFDIVFDGQTFSSLDLKKALPEMARVLKLGGLVIGIETLGHNPILNLKRKINVLLGKRTKWATGHIFKLEDLKEVKKYFKIEKIYFFHLISWLAFPFLKFPFGKTFLKILEKIDHLLLKIPFLKKYSFKIVFLFKK